MAKIESFMYGTNETSSSSSTFPGGAVVGSSSGQHGGSSGGQQWRKVEAEDRQQRWPRVLVRRSRPSEWYIQCSVI